MTVTREVLGVTTPHGARHTVTGRALVVFGVVLAGCAAPRPTTVTRAATGATTSTPPPPTRVSFELDGAIGRIDGPARTGPRRFMIAGRRAERTATGWDFSREMTRGIIAATETATGWVFVTEDGLVAASDRFAGPLRSIGTVPRLRSASPWTHGRVAIVSDDGLWSSDGRALTHHETPTPVLRSVFADVRRGAAVTVEGGLLLTSDEGATWRPSEALSGRASEVWANGCGFSVSTTRGEVLLRADGAASEAACPSALTPATPEDETNVRAAADDMLSAWRQRAGVPSDAVRLGDGSTLALAVNDASRTALVRRDASGRIVSQRAIEGGSSVEAWGQAAALQTRGQLWRSTDGTALELIHTPHDEICSNGSPMVFSDDGVHFAAMHGSAPPAQPSESILCAFDGLARRLVRLRGGADREGAWRLAAVRGATALVERSVGARPEDGSVWNSVDLDSGEVSVVLPNGVERERSRCHFNLGPGGWIVGVCAARDANGEGNASLLTRRGGAWVSRPAPARALRVAFADAQRGVATGAHVSDLWRTLDGGEHWEPVPLPAEGDVGDAPRATGYGEGDPVVRCDRDGCIVEPFRTRLSGWGPMRPDDERFSFGSARRARPITNLRCATSPTSPASQRPELAGGHPWNRGLWWHSGGILTWEDEDGSRGQTTVRQPPDELIARTRDGVVLRYVIAGVGFARGGAFLDVHAQLESNFAPSLMQMSPTGGFTDAAPTAPTAGGGAVAMIYAWVGADPQIRAPQMSIAFELDDRGRVLAARALPRLDRGAEGIASRQGQWGYVAVLPDRTVRFAPLRGESPMTIGRLPESIAPCAGPPLADAITLHLASVGREPLIVTSGDFAITDGRFDVEVSGASACLRSLRDASDPRRAVLVAERDALTGFVTDADHRRRAARCEVMP